MLAYINTRIRMKTYPARTHACVDSGPVGRGLAGGLDSALPNMGQSRRSIHKTTGRAAARLSSCATPTHRASFNNIAVHEPIHILSAELHLNSKESCI